MKKYDLSQIMKKAWATYKKFQKFITKLPFAECLRRAWADAKNTISYTSEITMCVYRNETFTVDTRTGKVSGKTYNSRKFLKDSFNAKWDGVEWTVDINKFKTELKTYPSYYHKYVVADTKKVEAYTKLVNRDDGFYSYVQYTDGTHEYVFVG